MFALGVIAFYLPKISSWIVKNGLIRSSSHGINLSLILFLVTGFGLVVYGYFIESNLWCKFVFAGGLMMPILLRFLKRIKTENAQIKNIKHYLLQARAIGPIHYYNDYKSSMKRAEFIENINRIGSNYDSRLNRVSFCKKFNIGVLCVFIFINIILILVSILVMYVFQTPVIIKMLQIALGIFIYIIVVYFISTTNIKLSVAYFLRNILLPPIYWWNKRELYKWHHIIQQQVLVKNDVYHNLEQIRQRDETAFKVKGFFAVTRWKAQMNMQNQLFSIVNEEMLFLEMVLDKSELVDKLPITKDYEPMMYKMT